MNLCVSVCVRETGERGRELGEERVRESGGEEEWAYLCNDQDRFVFVFAFDFAAVP